MTGKWIPGKTDLILSAAITLFFPLLAGSLYSSTGALLPMILYYSAAWGISFWRRGRSGYNIKNLPAPPISFYVHVIVIAITLVLSYLARITILEPRLAGVIFTALVWALINASSEQLLWLYIFDSWDLYGIGKRGKGASVLMRLAALLFFTIFVGTIHTMFWTRFLHTVNPDLTWGKIFIAGTTVSGYLHILVWRKSDRMIYTFIPHFMLNLFPLFWTGYSIMPYLLK